MIGNTFAKLLFNHDDCSETKRLLLISTAVCTTESLLVLV